MAGRKVSIFAIIVPSITVAVIPALTMAGRKVSIFAIIVPSMAVAVIPAATMIEIITYIPYHFPAVTMAGRIVGWSNVVYTSYRNPRIHPIAIVPHPAYHIIHAVTMAERKVSIFAITYRTTRRSWHCLRCCSSCRPTSVHALRRVVGVVLSETFRPTMA